MIITRGRHRGGPLHGFGDEYEWSDVGPRPVNIPCVHGHDEVPLSSRLIEVDSKDLVLGQSHLLEGVCDPRIFPWPCREFPVAASRENCLVVTYRPLPMPFALDDERRVCDVIADAGAVLQ